MIVDIGKLKGMMNYAYDNYHQEHDDAGQKIDWLEGTIGGIFTKDEGDNFYIVFRGTDQNKKSDEVNFKFFANRLPYVGVNPKIWVHTGLIDMYDTPKCRQVLRARVQSAINKNPNVTVWVVGHSQGGGMAQICAVDVQYYFGDRIKSLICVPMSPMRAGNKHFIASLMKRVPNTIVVWRGSDWVPLIPPFFVGYKLPTRRVQINKRNFFLKAWNLIAAPIAFIFIGRQKKHKFYDNFISFLTLTARGPDWYFVNDHDMDDYPEPVLEINNFKEDKITQLKWKK
jgi:pimeloyl-ACP methyl ester carboxylesterase